ncbi:MAG: antitoxin VapB family protein [Candidatus Thermoplasmatota archaeon]|jgi:predicted CopG family antitoxin|nr:antitoxin VapB family protein [Candidatus Thermoplasmatota archaeon]
MGSKNISISDEAYLRLSELKLKNESFTELIYRLTNKTNVLDLKDIIKEDEGKSLEKNIRDSRKLTRERINKITSELNR